VHVASSAAIAKELNDDVTMLWDGIVHHLREAERVGVQSGQWQEMLRYFMNRMKALDRQSFITMVSIIHEWRRGNVDVHML
jgi:hypothetical protein